MPFYKLVDTGSIFYDSSQKSKNNTITGSAVVQLEYNKKVAKAISDRVIVEATEAEHKAWVKIDEAREKAVEAKKSADQAKKEAPQAVTVNIDTDGLAAKVADILGKGSDNSEIASTIQELKEAVGKAPTADEVAKAIQFRHTPYEDTFAEKIATLVEGTTAAEVKSTAKSLTSKDNLTPLIGEIIDALETLQAGKKSDTGKGDSKS